MRSSVYRRRNSGGSERECLIPDLPDYGGVEHTEANNGTMRLPGISLQSPSDGSETRPQYIAALSSTLGALAMGAVLGWSSPVGLKFTQNEAYSFPVTVEQSAWVSSIINLGAAVVCFPIGLVMDAIGRKKTMMYLVIPFLLGWLLITFAQNVPMLIIGRFITGVAGGAFCITAPAYNSEIAVDSIRGSLGSYFQLMITVGILFAYVVGSYTSVLVFNILCTILPLIFGIVFFFMPESPKYLVSKNRNDEAKDALIWLRGKNYNFDDELNRMRQANDESSNQRVSIMSALKKKPALKVLIICYALMLAQQLSGINAVIFNTGTIFDSAGASILPAIATIIIGIIQVVATFVSSLVVDKLGRRILLLLSALVMCVCSTALGVFFFLKERGENVEAISWLPLVSLSLFIIAFSLGFGPIPWMMAGELCTMEIKSFVASTAGVLNWLLSFAVTSTFSTLNSTLGSGQVFWLFAGIMVLAFLFIFFIVPETKGKSVEEVQVLLGAEVNVSNADKH